MYHNEIKIFSMRCDKSVSYKGKIEKIPNTLEAKQDFVDGYIQEVRLTEDIDIICNDDGKLDGLPINRIWLLEDNYAHDVFVGNIFACRHDDAGNFTSILESDIPLILDRLIAIKFITDTKLVMLREELLPNYEDDYL